MKGYHQTRGFSKNAPKVWEKATQYAVQVLFALGLAEATGHLNVSITSAGKAILDNERIKEIFHYEMQLPLIRNS
jgi:hypothetical protein